MGGLRSCCIQSFFIDKCCKPYAKYTWVSENDECGNIRWEIEWQHLIGILATKQKWLSTLNYLISCGFREHKSFVPSIYNFHHWHFGMWMANPLIRWNVLANEQRPDLQALGRGDATKGKCPFKPKYHTSVSLRNLFHGICLESFHLSQSNMPFSCAKSQASEPVQICGWRVVTRFHGQSHPYLSGHILRVLEEVLASAPPTVDITMDITWYDWIS